jgi:hypothetical protein
MREWGIPISSERHLAVAKLLREMAKSVGEPARGQAIKRSNSHLACVVLAAKHRGGVCTSGFDFEALSPDWSIIDNQITLLNSTSEEQTHLMFVGPTKAVRKETPQVTAAERTLSTTCSWLRSRGLTAKTFPIDFQDFKGHQIDAAQIGLAAPQQRTKQHTKSELETLKKIWSKRHIPFDGITLPPSIAVVKQLDDLLDRETSRLFLDMRRLPSDAIAFYRPYHLEPVDRWGIYIFVDCLLHYAEQVRFDVPFFCKVSKEVFMHLVLFEMFHHEFYHHLVESAATTIEILADALGAPIPSYLDYRRGVHKSTFSWHKHQPLEETLANAYAYNSLSFISRVKAGYKDALVGSYQKALAIHWGKKVQAIAMRPATSVANRWLLMVIYWQCCWAGSGIRRCCRSRRR